MMMLSVIIILMFCFMTYRFMYTTIEQKMKQSQEYLIEKAAENVDYSLSNVEYTLNLVARDDNVINAAMIPGVMSDNKYERNMRILNLLQHTEDNSPYIKSLFIVETKENGIFTSYGSMYSMDEFFEKDYINACLGSSNVISESKDGYGRIKLVNIDEKIYMTNEFLYSVSDPLSVIIAELDKEKIFGIMADAENNANSPIVINSQGEMILKNGYDENNENIVISDFTKVAGEGVFWDGNSISYKSSYSNWIYILPNISSMVTLTVKESIVSVLPIICMFLIIGFAVSLSISKYIYKPINRIIDIAKENEEDDGENEIVNDMDYLEAAIIKSKEKNIRMKMVLKNISQEVTDNYLRKIIFETNTSAEESIKKLSEFNSPLSEEGKYTVMVAKTGEDGFDITDRKHCISEIKNVLSNYFEESDQTYSVLLDKGQVVVVMRFSDAIDEMDAAVAVKKIKTHLTKITKTYASDARVYSGEIYKYLGGIRYAYRDCIYEAEESKNTADSEKSYFRSLIYYFVQEFNDGNVSEAKRLIGQITEEFNVALISQSEKEELIKSIILTILDVAGNNNLGMLAEDIRKISKRFAEHGDEKALLDDINMIVYQMADAVEANKKKPYYGYLAEAKAFIEENYHDSNLSLGIVAEKIGINKAYLSSIFNENLKIGFLDYLNGHRIEKAKELLDNSDMPVKDIAEAVGFSTVQTFIRVFKKTEGIPPGTYRKK